MSAFTTLFNMLYADLSGSTRLFTAEFDFRRYFDNIGHDHVWRVLHDQRFLLTPAERSIIRSFLRAPTLSEGGYHPEDGPPRVVGIPQGTSISLFLANVAAWELDRRLERLGVGFARYADDTLIWSSDYERVCQAVDALTEASEMIGAPLNFEKSPGIRLLVPSGSPAEMASTEHVDFVGYSVTVSSLGLRERKIRDIHRKVDQLIYRNLLHEPLNGTQDPARLGTVDRDYATLIWQLRRYLYGDASEGKIRRYLAGGIPPIKFKGLLAHYPLIDDESQLAALDKYLARSVWLATRKRAQLLHAAGLPVLPPLGLPMQRLVRFRRQSTTTGGTLDLRLPSFRRMSTVLRRAATLHGPSSVGSFLPYGY